MIFLLSVWQGLSQAEIDRVCRDAIKTTILENKNHVAAELLQRLLRERHLAYDSKKK